MTDVAERDALLTRGDALWQALRAGLDENLDRPLGPSTDWTGHDVYAHFARWQAQTLFDLQRLTAGRRPEPVPGTEEEINERWRAEDREVSTEVVRARCIETRGELRMTLMELSADQWRLFGEECAQDITEAHLAPHLSMIGK